MVCNRSLARFGLVATLGFAAVAARAITFTNIVIASPPMSTGAGHTILGPSISFTTPNAVVGDVVDPIRFGILSIQFDVTSDVGMASNQVFINLAAFVTGSGRIDFTERVIELSGPNGTELGQIGFAEHTFLPGGGTTWSRTIQFPEPVQWLRVKKDFVLTAPVAETVDLAALGIVNQSFNVVPEPATVAILGLGAAALLRRRRR